MYTPAAFLCAFSLLLTSTFALPAFTTGYLDITDLRVHWTQNGTTVVEFVIQDEEPSANTPGPCTGTWITKPDASGKTIVCPTTFTCSVDSWNSYNDFGLHFSHVFKDPSVGQPPNDHTTVFANVDIKEPAQLNCVSLQESPSKPEFCCTQPSGTIIKAPITSAIAKK